MHFCGLHRNEVLGIERDGKFLVQVAYHLYSFSLKRKKWLRPPIDASGVEHGTGTDGPTPEWPNRKLVPAKPTAAGWKSMTKSRKAANVVEFVDTGTPEEAMEWSKHPCQDLIVTILRCKTASDVVQELKKKGFDTSSITKFHSGGLDLPFSSETLLEERRLAEKLESINAQSSPQGDMS